MFVNNVILCVKQQIPHNTLQKRHKADNTYIQLSHFVLVNSMISIWYIYKKQISSANQTVQPHQLNNNKHTPFIQACMHKKEGRLVNKNFKMGNIGMVYRDRKAR